MAKNKYQTAKIFQQKTLAGQYWVLGVGLRKTTIQWHLAHKNFTKVAAGPVHPVLDWETLWYYFFECYFFMLKQLKILYIINVMKNRTYLC